MVTLAFLRISSKDGGRATLGKVSKVLFVEGRKPTVNFSGGTLRIVVAPSQGLAGRPSSEKVVKALKGAK